jgi:hypothetical protein
MNLQSDITIENLPDEFIGRGSTKKFIFTKFKDTDEAAIFKVSTGNGTYHFEVFKKQIAPLCVDFANHVYSDTNFKYTYPTDNAFGKWAWTAPTVERAVEICSNLVNAVAIKAAEDLGFIEQIKNKAQNGTTSNNDIH